MKLTLSPSRDQSNEVHRHLTVSVEDVNDDQDLDAVVEMFRSLLLAAGYHEQQVRERLGAE